MRVAFTAAYPSGFTESFQLLTYGGTTPRPALARRSLSLFPTAGGWTAGL